MRLFRAGGCWVAALPLAYIDAQATGQVYGLLSRSGYYSLPEPAAALAIFSEILLSGCRSARAISVIGGDSLRTRQWR